jgi:hypothetical protein
VKLSRLRLVRGVVSVVVCLAVGCVSTKKTESLLLEAGFKITRADTPEKQAHLKSLPAGKVIRVNRDGVVYYVYADVKNNVLYVGKEPEYQQYKNDLWLAQRTSENQNQAEYLEGTASMIWNGGGVWEVWGPSD